MKLLPRPVVTRCAQNVLRHRPSYIVVRDGARNILVQRRTTRKDFYPGYLDANLPAAWREAVRGCFSSACRKAEEDLGIIDVLFVKTGNLFLELRLRAMEKAHCLAV